MVIEGIDHTSSSEYVDIWGVAKGNGFSPYEHVHLTGFGDLEITAVGAAFSRDKIVMTPTTAFVEKEGAMEDESEVIKVGHKEMTEFSICRESDGIDSFEMFPNQSE